MPDRVDTAEAADEVLFSEPGARWRAVAYGPLFCVLLLIAEVAVGATPHWFVLLFCAILISGFAVLQVYAARTHASVELTGSFLRNGPETTPVRSIAAVLPVDADEPWEDGRALGELTGVPRRRTAIGLRRIDGELVRTWAKDHRALRAALNQVVTASGTDRDSGPGTGRDD
ncbi:hypothetical protein [Nocardia sp. NBC_01329]|uniref:hypothetical protein n=1 Tax=Nocardia sp. NBC_01329 TaxID=2903594 RepID=UPI002E0E28EA|nr:hypothetical protein OG405_28310 [Nocardia sp. NBC_01329]